VGRTFSLWLANSQLCGSASLKFKRLQLFLARHRELVRCSVGSTAFGPLRRRFDLDRRVLRAAPAKRFEQRSLDENETSLWGERSRCGSANSRFCGSASLKFKRLQLFFARHRELICGSAGSTAFGLSIAVSIWIAGCSMPPPDAVLLLGGKPHEF
jgi:hypothetical protein